MGLGAELTNETFQHEAYGEEQNVLEQRTVYNVSDTIRTSLIKQST